MEPSEIVKRLRAYAHLTHASAPWGFAGEGYVMEHAADLIEKEIIGMASKKKGFLTAATSWAKHLRPWGKRKFWKAERKAAKQCK